MKTVKIYCVGGEPGYAQVNYRTVPNKQLICTVDDIWHSCTDDNCWNEPIAPLKLDGINLEVISETEAKKLITEHNHGTE
jgi:hypothetical protein